MQNEWCAGTWKLAQRMLQDDGRITDAPSMLWVRAVRR